MRFIKLSDVELAVLTYAQCNGKPFKFRNRCHCLMLSHHGYTIPELTKMFNVHRVTVYAYLIKRGLSCSNINTDYSNSRR